MLEDKWAVFALDSSERPPELLCVSDSFAISADYGFGFLSMKIYFIVLDYIRHVTRSKQAIAIKSEMNTLNTVLRRLGGCLSHFSCCPN